MNASKRYHDELSAMHAACTEADQYRGATSPNPPVGAAALDSKGAILAIGAHHAAGTPHAEARVLTDVRGRGLGEQVHTLVVTLEPCNHTGRTPACTEMILNRTDFPNLKRVVYGHRDPNPHVEGGGADRLREAGVDVEELRLPECVDLITPWLHWIRTGLPWVTVKKAVREGVSEGQEMIPPPGQKTFTSPGSLALAHDLRRRADAILTGSGTVLADQPEFTVRLVADPRPPTLRRTLMILDRRERVPLEYINLAESRGFQLKVGTDYVAALEYLGAQGCQELLVEAGPSLTESIKNSGFWNEFVVIQSGQTEIDTVQKTRNVHWNHPNPRKGSKT